MKVQSILENAANQYSSPESAIYIYIYNIATLNQSIFLLLPENRLQAMFPLGYAHVHAHTGCETSAHKKTWSTYFTFKDVFAHMSYTSFQIQMSPGKMLHKICGV